MSKNVTVWDIGRTYRVIFFGCDSGRVRFADAAWLDALTPRPRWLAEPQSVPDGTARVNYLIEANVLDQSSANTSPLLIICWGRALVGSLIGTAVLLALPAGKALAFVAISAAVLTGVTVFAAVTVFSVALLAVGLFTLIPTILTPAFAGQWRERGTPVRRNFGVVLRRWAESPGLGSES